MSLFGVPLAAAGGCEVVALGGRRRVIGTRTLAKRASSLDGAVLALIDNTKNSPHFPRAVIDALCDSYPIDRVLWIVKESMSVPLEAEAWNSVRAEATVAVTMYGECGSCSSQSIRDALELEWSGIPAVCIAHEALAPSIDAMEAISGAPGYPYLRVTFPTQPNAPLSPAECRHWATTLTPAIAGLLVACPVPGGDRRA
jgi:hypothetical protein